MEQEYHARLASIVESSDDAILSKDLDGTVRTWNPAAHRLFGYSEAEIVGRNITLIIPQERRHEEKMIQSRMRRGQKVEHYETQRQTRDGRLIDVSISVAPIRDAAGKVLGASTIIRDMSSRKQAEIALRESEQRMRAIVDTAVDAIITIDERGIMETVNPSAEKLFGYLSSELLGRNVKMLMPEPYRGEHDGYLRNYLRTGIRKIIGIGREVTGLRKDGSTFPMSLSVSEVPLGERRLFTGIVHDLSGRRLLERQIVDASTEEQRRIGQDLHDGLCQDLIGIAFQADFAARQLAARHAPETDAVNKLAMNIRDAAGQARRLSHGLNPVDLKAGGLPVALEALAAKVTESFNISCEFHGNDDAQVDNDLTATHLYRIAQEAVSNAIRHGKAKRIAIEIVVASGRLTLTVKDDGVGLPPALLQVLSTAPTTGAPKPIDHGGIGLQTMHYRANMIGGTFEIKPARGRGTLVTCTLRSVNVKPRPKARRSRGRTAVRVR